MKAQPMGLSCPHLFNLPGVKPCDLGCRESRSCLGKLDGRKSIKLFFWVNQGDERLQKAVSGSAGDPRQVLALAFAMNCY